MKLIKKLLKLLGILVIGVAIACAIFFAPQYVTSFNTQGVATTTQSVATPAFKLIEEKDVLDESQEELERIKRDLDAEEAKLLEEIEERELRLERIREIRLSFQ